MGSLGFRPVLQSPPDRNPADISAPRHLCPRIHQAAWPFSAAPACSCAGHFWPRSTQGVTAWFVTRLAVPAGPGGTAQPGDTAQPVLCVPGHSGTARAALRCSCIPQHQGLVLGCWMGNTSLSYQTTTFILSLSSSLCCHGTCWHVLAFGVPASPSCSSPFPPAPPAHPETLPSISAAGESGCGKQVHKSSAMLGNKNRYCDEWDFISVLRRGIMKG